MFGPPRGSHSLSEGGLCVFIQLDQGFSELTDEGRLTIRKELGRATGKELGEGRATHLI